MVWETNILYFLVRIMLFETTWKKKECDSLFQAIQRCLTFFSPLCIRNPFEHMFMIFFILVLSSYAFICSFDVLSCNSIFLVLRVIFQCYVHIDNPGINNCTLYKIKPWDKTVCWDKPLLNL